MQRSGRDAMHALDWDDVRLFLVLSRSRTMGAAARTLRVDPSTVSRRLVALEEALDTTLFDRGREGLRATPAAEALLPTAERVEMGIAQFANAADTLEREVAGVVRITCPPDVADVVVLPVIQPLLAAHPALRISLLPGEATVDLNRREADLALRIVRPTRGDLVVKRVLQVAWSPAASPELAADIGALSDLSAVPWIGFGEHMQGVPACRWLDAQLAGEPVLRTDSLATQIAAARAGMGVALLPDPSIDHYGLVRVPFAPEARAADARRPSDQLYLVTHRVLRDVPRVRAVWQALVEHFASF